MADELGFDIYDIGYYDPFAAYGLPDWDTYWNEQFIYTGGGEVPTYENSEDVIPTDIPDFTQEVNTALDEVISGQSFWDEMDQSNQDIFSAMNAGIVAELGMEPAIPSKPWYEKVGDFFSDWSFSAGASPPRSSTSTSGTQAKTGTLPTTSTVFGIPASTSNTGFLLLIGIIIIIMYFIMSKK